jgi:hypothetical protein
MPMKFPPLRRKRWIGHNFGGRFAIVNDTPRADDVESPVRKRQHLRVTALRLRFKPVLGKMLSRSFNCNNSEIDAMADRARPSPMRVIDADAGFQKFLSMVTRELRRGVDEWFLAVPVLLNRTIPVGRMFLAADGGISVCSANLRLP